LPIAQCNVAALGRLMGGAAADKLPGPPNSVQPA
jgi:hypothetical protein